MLVSGDALVTGHPTSRLAGPQLLPGMFHADRARTLASLAALEAIQAGTLLAGHGPVHRGDVREAVARARERRRGVRSGVRGRHGARGGAVLGAPVGASARSEDAGLAGQFGGREAREGAA
ncbi:hypothetical protein GA0115246_100262 [Streptomyces sp. SolWspMP-sol7th]|nr:hypothetical protein GA0115246_100262 [Streptomyces sp. SolWspMP-sol7th]